MELNKIKEIKFQQIVLKLYFSFYRRIHSWGLLILLMLLYLSSIGLQSAILLKWIGRLGLMSIHVLSGFGLILVFIMIAYNYLQQKLFPVKEKNNRSHALANGEQPAKKSGNRHLVDWLFYVTLMIVCCLGLTYYFLKEFSLDSSLVHHSTVSLLHAIVGWFFLSLVFVRYYLTLAQKFRELSNYLRG